MENELKLLSEEIDKQDWLMSKKDEEITDKSIMLDIREYDRKVHNNTLYYTTEDEEDVTKLKKIGNPSKIPTKYKENAPNYKVKDNNSSQEILIKNEKFSKSSNNVEINQIETLRKALEIEKLKNEALTRQLQEKQAEVATKSNFKGDFPGDSAKTQPLHEKIKKLKEKLNKTRADAEENKRLFLLKSEKDDKYIELLKQELEKLKKTTMNSKKSSTKP